jgi:hypothetical protein
MGLGTLNPKPLTINPCRQGWWALGGGGGHQRYKLVRRHLGRGTSVQARQGEYCCDALNNGALNGLGRGMLSNKSNTEDED